MKKRKFVACLMSFLVCQTCSAGVFADGGEEAQMSSTSSKPPRPPKEEFEFEKKLKEVKLCEEKLKQSRKVYASRKNNSVRMKNIPFKLGDKEITNSQWSEMIKDKIQKRVDDPLKHIIISKSGNFCCTVCGNKEVKGEQRFSITRRSLSSYWVFCNQCKTSVSINTEGKEKVVSVIQHSILDYFNCLKMSEKHCSKCGLRIDENYQKSSCSGPDCKGNIGDCLSFIVDCPKCTDCSSVWLLNEKGSFKEKKRIYMCQNCKLLFGDFEIASKILEHAKKITEEECEHLKDIRVYNPNLGRISQSEPSEERTSKVLETAGTSEVLETAGTSEIQQGEQVLKMVGIKTNFVSTRNHETLLFCIDNDYIRNLHDSEQIYLDVKNACLYSEDFKELVVCFPHANVTITKLSSGEYLCSLVELVDSIPTQQSPPLSSVNLFGQPQSVISSPFEQYQYQSIFSPAPDYMNQYPTYQINFC